MPTFAFGADGNYLSQPMKSSPGPGLFGRLMYESYLRMYSAQYNYFRAILESRGLEHTLLRIPMRMRNIRRHGIKKIGHREQDGGTL